MLSSIFALLTPALGFLIETLISRKYSKDVIRSIEVCEDKCIEVIKDKVSTIIDFFRKEINRIFNLMDSDEIDLESIKSFELKEFNEKDTKNTLNSIRQANKYISRLESALTRIKIYRWIFIVIFSLALLELIVFTIFNWKYKIAEYVFVIFSFLIILIFFCDHTRISNFIDEIGRSYGLPK